MGTASTAGGDAIVVVSCCSVRCRLLLLRVKPPPKMRDQSVFEALARPGHAAEQIEAPEGHHRCQRDSAIRASTELYVGASCYAMHRSCPEAARQGRRQGVKC